MKPLYLITESYPFTAEEASFLHAELRALARAFDVTLLPFRVWGEEPVEPLPDGVRVERLRNARPLALYLAMALFQADFWRELLAARRGVSLRAWARRASVIWVHGARALRYQRCLRKYLQKQPSEGVLYFFWTTPQTYAFARLKGRFPDLRFAARAHGYDLYQAAAKQDWLPYRPCIDRRLDRLFFVCEQGKAYYLRRWSRPDGPKYQARYLGCEGFAQTEPPAPDGVFTVVSCSNVIPVKRVRLLAEALALWPEGVPLRWVHFGDGALLPELRAQASALTAARPELQIELRGRVPNASLAVEYAALRPHALANVSSSEGLPVSMMEALSAGIPLLGLAVGGVPELVTAGTGVLLPADADARAICDGLLALAREPCEAQLARRAAARALWAGSFRAADCAQAVCGELTALCNAEADGRA